MARDPEATKARLFEAAVQEFAQFGIEAARLDRIAEKARANKQLIYRYFGDKRDLFDAVIAQAMNDLSQAIEVTPQDIPGYLEAIREYHRQNPHVLRLLLWEALDGSRPAVVAEESRRDHYAGKTARFASAQQEGTIGAAIPPDILTLILLGLVNWPQAVPQMTELITGEGPGSDRLQAATVEAATRITKRD
ncbi:MAG TPA: TetR family transcriptional regulator [Lacisediminihabitans sp.]|uniref:TetR family transcriptional regulator n=1 Tax=Lacisediminihabitans sp. TaxID=2787631 RepID=UPI002ED9BC64